MELKAIPVPSLAFPEDLLTRHRRDFSLSDHLLQIADPEAISMVLEWDEMVNLPDNGSDARARQLALAATDTHRLQTDPEFVAIVSTLNENLHLLSSDQAIQARELKRIMERQLRLPEDFVQEKTKAISMTRSVWEKAKPANDFKSVEPHLARSIELLRKEAEHVGYQENPYDALFDEHEPGAQSKVVRPVLQSLAKELAKMIPLLTEKYGVIVEKPKREFAVSAQRMMVRKIARDLGFDFDSGRIDESSHPFMSSLGPRDIRICTHFEADSCIKAISSTIHETGHALYELGLPETLYGTPLGNIISLGIHESQSRFWENHVGRSRAFMNYLHRTIDEFFPSELGNPSPDSLWRDFNTVVPSLIRTAADEVTYSLHVVIRTLIEDDLVNERLRVSELPKRWGDLYEEYLGLRPVNDTDGVMQDTHWYSGLIGYFPTYVLGNLYAAGMAEKMETDIPNLDSSISAGDFSAPRDWLRENVHCHGRRYSADELNRRITGKDFSAEPFLNYLRRKFP